MRLRILSDVHVECEPRRIEELARSFNEHPDFDTLLIAGDLSNFFLLETALEEIAAAVTTRPVVYVMGNHEHYGSYFGNAQITARKVQAQHRNLHFLTNETVEIDGTRFVGTTLWYPRPTVGGWEEFSDFRYCRGLAEVIHDEASAARDFLAGTVREGDVVITHHLPCPDSVAPRWRNSPSNEFFVHNVADTVHRAGAALWVHGHTHTSCDYLSNKTRVVCNPWGYTRAWVPTEPNPTFDLALTIQV